MGFDPEISVYKIHQRAMLLFTAFFSVFAAHAEDFDPFASEQLPERTSKPQPVPRNPESATPQPGPKNPETAKPRKTKKSPKKESVKKQVEIVAPPPPPPPPPAPKVGDLKLEIGLENYNTFSYIKPVFDSAQYTENQILIPFGDLHTRLRPSIKLTAGRAFSLHTRPYFEIRNQQAFLSDKKRKSKTDFLSDMGESVFNLNVSNRVSLTAGQENFQWGGAELNGPSNWIYRSTELAESITRNPQTQVRTRRTVRLNFSAGQSFNVVAIAEFDPEKRTMPGIYEGRRFLLKPEVSWNSGADYFGFVVGGAERQKFPFFGEYTSVNIGDSMAIYIDAAHYKGSDLVRPQTVIVPSQLGPQKITILAQPDLDSDKLNHEVLLGLRYAFVNGTELRFEGYANSAGYSLTETRLVEDLYDAKSPLFPMYFFPGGETRAQRSLFFSMRRNNFGKNKNWTVLGRYWKPIADSSGGAVVYTDYGITDNATVYLAAGGFHGPLISDSSLAQRFVITLGQKYVW